MKSFRVQVVVFVGGVSLAVSGALWGMPPRLAVAPNITDTQPDPTAVRSPQLLPGAAIVPPGFIYGVSVADLNNTPRVKELGFPWMKSHLPWRAVEAKRGQYRWTDLDKAIRAATENNLGLVLRVDRAPEWSHPSNRDPAAPPDSEFLPDFRRFLQIAAARGAGRVLAYEIWNEPNLSIEWGGKPPDAAGYARLLQAGYEGVKAGDPNALVVSAGLANTDEQSARSTDELVFLRAFYQAGATPYFD